MDSNWNIHTYCDLWSCSKRKLISFNLFKFFIFIFTTLPLFLSSPFISLPNDAQFIYILYYIIPCTFHIAILIFAHTRQEILTCHEHFTPRSHLVYLKYVIKMLKDFSWWLFKKKYCLHVNFYFFLLCSCL